MTTVPGFQWTRVRRTMPAHTQVPGALVNVSSSGSHVWGINAEDKIFRWNNGTNSWQEMPGAAKHVSVGYDGTVWVANAARELYKWNGNGWDKMPGGGTCVSVGSANNVWVSNQRKEIYRWDGQKYTRMDGACAQISAGKDGSVACVNDAGEVWHRDSFSAPWVKLNAVPSGAVFVSIHKKKYLTATGTDKGIYSYDGSNWVKAPGGASQVSVGGGKWKRVWVTNHRQEIYRHGQ